ncbi:MAG: helix-turn-helix domain-containing protein [Pirellulales bacterium]
MRPKGSAAELEARRQRAVRLLAQGKTNAKVAELVDASVSSVKRWKAAWKKGGSESLAAKPHPGPSSRLSEVALALSWSVDDRRAPNP